MIFCRAPVANVSNTPFRRRFEVDHEINAFAVRAVDEPPTENHLATSLRRAGLARCEAQCRQDRIEDGRDLVE